MTLLFEAGYETLDDESLPEEATTITSLFIAYCIALLIAGVDDIDILKFITLTPISTASRIASSTIEPSGAVRPIQYGKSLIPGLLFPPETPAIPTLLFVLALAIPATKVP